MGSDHFPLTVDLAFTAAELMGVDEAVDSPGSRRRPRATVEGCQIDSRIIVSLSSSLIGPNGVAIVPAATETIRNDDVTHEFRQDSDFFYLTGFHEPEALAVLVPGHPDGDYHLFVRPRDQGPGDLERLPRRGGRCQGTVPGR